MRVLFLLGKDKSALSNMVGYVFLISITIGLSVLVYGWLRFYVDVDEVEECPDGVDIVINSYECYPTDEFGTGRLKVVLKNKGRFVVDGYTLRVHDRPGADFGFYVLDDVGVVLAPGEEHEQTYEFSDFDFDGHNLSDVTLAEVQPFLLEDDKISCRSHVMQEISCYWDGSSGGGFNVNYTCLDGTENGDCSVVNPSLYCDAGYLVFAFGMCGSDAGKCCQSVANPSPCASSLAINVMSFKGCNVAYTYFNSSICGNFSNNTFVERPGIAVASGSYPVNIECSEDFFDVVPPRPDSQGKIEPYHGVRERNGSCIFVSFGNESAGDVAAQKVIEDFFYHKNSFCLRNVVTGVGDMGVVGI